jgi:thioredoxin-related protein
MKPIVHGLEARYGDRIGFVYLDVDDPNTDDLKQALDFRYMPYFVLLDGDGNILRRWAGPVTEAEFVAAFDDVLAP